MIKATGGIWINYATTIVFQILFASRFGVGHEATVFAITFTIAVALTSVVVTTTQSVVLPRLIDAHGAVLRSALQLMALLVLVSAVCLGAVAIAAVPIASLLGHLTNIGPSELVEPLRYAALFAFTQIVAGQMVALAIARGQRFVPAFAPAFPSLAAVALLGLNGEVSLDSVFAFLAIGTVVEIAFLGLTQPRPLHVVPGSLDSVGSTTLMTIVQFGLLSLLPPFDTVMASLHSSAGGAEYNYAIRSLAVAQQLLIGGMVLSSIGQWSLLARRAQVSDLTRSLGRRLMAGGMILSLSAAIAIVAGEQLVALVYQHGNFTSRDTTRVTILLLLAVGGFVAEGLSMILSQSFLAERRNRLAVGFGYGRFLLRVGFVLALAPILGARGVALGYTLASTAVVLAQFVWLARARGERRLGRDGSVARGFTVAIGTIGFAVILAIAAPGAPALVRVALVVGAFSLAFLALRPGRGANATGVLGQP